MDIVIQDTGKRDKDRNIICVAKCHCGKEFETQKRNIIKSRIKSCGCSRQKDITGQIFGLLEVVCKNGKVDKLEGVMYNCKCQCGKIIELSNAKITHPSRRSCGCDKTRIILACKRRSGKNHHWYNQNLSEEDRKQKKRNSDEVYEFRQKVYQRDSYCCVICGQKGGYLVVHHLDAYHWCKEKRTNPQNGVTLCKYCHKLFHKIYTNKNNNRFQFLEFKKDYANFI